MMAFSCDLMHAQIGCNDKCHLQCGQARRIGDAQSPERSDSKQGVVGRQVAARL